MASINLCAVFLQLGDYAPARKAAEQAVRDLEDKSPPIFLIQALGNLGSIQFIQGQAREGKQSYTRAIVLAQGAQLMDAESLGQDQLGRELLDIGDLQGAERALDEAYRLRSMAHDQNMLAVTRANLAELQFRQGKFQNALTLLDSALSTPSQDLSIIPPYEPCHLRGQILMALQRHKEGLYELERATQLAGWWREGALPGSATGARTVARLSEVYRDYATAAAEQALQSHDQTLARKALEVWAQNRAASLREQLQLSLQETGQLPPRYYELLQDLQAEQAKYTLGSNTQEEGKVEQIRQELSAIANRISTQSTIFSRKYENLSRKSSLRDIQSRLEPTELLLSFCLSAPHSYLWTVTGEHVDLFRLPSQSEITEDVRRFAAAVEFGRPAEALGQKLSHALFSQVPVRTLKKTDWLVAGDGVMLTAFPLAAVANPVTDRVEPTVPNGNGATRSDLLGAEHSLRSIPSELLLLTESSEKATARVVAIGDPVYNAADIRRPRIEQPSAAEAESPTYRSPGLTLARLVGSEREIRTVARQSGLPETSVLSGPDATVSHIRVAFEGKPEIIHFAVHVVSPPGHPEQAALALSLGKGGMPELLTPETIATFRVPGSMVVLSGCASQQGETLPSAGLVGLSRAWVTAGASAVIVSSWPTPDDSGMFFSSFYSHYQAARALYTSIPQRAATALAKAQIDMQHTNSFQKAPAFWAAFSVIAKE